MKSLFSLLTLLLFVPAEAAPAARHRVAVASFYAESNAFYPAKVEMKRSPLPATREEWLRASAPGSGTLNGIVVTAAGVGIDLYPTVMAGASFLGAVTAESFQRNLDELIKELKSASPAHAGIFLVNHGALVVHPNRHGDADAARRIRQEMGPKFPIIVTNDFHANVSPELVTNSDAVITYKEYPHIDRKERGVQAAELMAKILTGEVKPTQAIAKPAMLFNLIHQNTFTGYMKAIVAECRRLERENPKILAVSFPGGYQWSDVEWMGPSAIVVTNNDPALAQREAKRLADMLYAQRDTFVFDPPDTAESVRMAMAEKKSPVVLMDTGDNIGGGSAGDSTHFLVEFLRQKTQGWAMSLADAEAVKIAAKAGVGGRFEGMVGAKRDKLHGEPVRITGTVRSLRTEPSAAAVIEVDGATGKQKNMLLITSRSSGGRNAAEYSDNGIDPKKQHILVSKGTVAPFETFQHVAGRIILVATPGPTDVNVSRFKYTHVRRPLHGLK